MPERDITIELLQLVSTREGLTDVARAVTGLLQAWSGCDAVGLRLRDGDDYPYFETRGLSPAFVAAENRLCTGDYDEHGLPILACMCGRVLQGQTDPELPWFTPFGSFWTNSSTELIAGATLPPHTRNRCNSAGYESVALLPLRQGGQCLGLLHFCDRRRGHFTTAALDLLERAATAVAIVVHDQRSTNVARDGELALRDAVAELAAIYRDAPSAMFLLDDDLRICKANAAAARLGHADEARLLGRPVPERVRCDHAAVHSDCAYCALRDTLETGRRHEEVDLGMTIAGVEHWLSISTSRLEFAGRRRVLVCAQDVTARRRAEQALRAAEVRHRTIFDQSPLAILLLRDGKYIYANAAAAECMGYPDPAALAGVPYETTVAPAALATLRERARRASAGLGNPRLEITLHRLDGSERVMESTSVPIELADGPAILITGQDITARKRGDERIRLQAAVLEQIQDCVTITDLDGRITYLNEAECRKMRRASQDLVGQSVEVFGDDPARGATQVEIIERTRTDGRWRGEVVNFGADGSEHLLDLRSFVVRDDAGEPIAMCGISTDVTQQRRLEAQYRQAQKMEAVGRLAAGVAHDFNNQLTVIRGYCDLLLAGRPPDDPLRRPLQEIMRASERARETTSHLLSFSRKQVLSPQPTHLGEFVTSLRAPISTLIGEDIHLEITQGKLTRSVLVDRSGMHQALINLIVNARDAMERGGELKIRVEDLDLAADGLAEFPDTEPGPYVLVEVSDHGCGMDAATLERVYDPFFTTKPTGKGTGLGLPMVQGFVRQSRGALAIVSAPGAGTTVRIILPQALPARPPALAADEESPADLPRGDETVLVVEDDPGVRELVAGCLKECGYHTLAAACASEALGLLHGLTGRLHLLVSDLVMPEMNGVDLAALVTGARPRVRTLFISGYADRALLESVPQLLKKPFSRRELAVAVREALDG